MTGSLDPRAASRRFAMAAFLFWLPVGLYLPSQVLLITERGMSLAVVAGLFAVHSLTVSVLELPTGGLSDVIGRRTVLAAAGVLNLTALSLLAVGGTVWVLVLAMVLMGSGRALSSGPAEAWYVDTVQAHAGPDAELRRGLARGGTAAAGALAVGTLCGGSLPWLLGLGPDLGARLSAATGGTLLPLSVPMLLGTAVGVVFTAYVLTALPEPPRPPATLRGVLRGVPVTVLDGLRLGTRDALIRRILLTSGAAGTALATIELLAPGRAATVTGAPESGALLFASLACAGFVCTALGSHCGPLTARLIGSRERAVLASVSVSAAGLLLLGITMLWNGPTALALAATGYALVYFGFGATRPNQNELLHQRITSGGRATALSVQSLALQLCGALAGLIAGNLPIGPLPWLLFGTVLVAAAVLWTRGIRPATAAAPVSRTTPSASSASSATSASLSSSATPTATGTTSSGPSSD